MQKLTIVPFVFLLFLGGAYEAQAKRVESVWRGDEQAIVIDAVLDEWPSERTVLKKTDIAIGVMNDEDHLYLSLMVRDAGVRRQILMQGLTLWFRQGNDSMPLGIRFPLGLRATGMMPSGADGGPARGMGEPPKARDLDPETIQNRLEQMLSQLEIFRDDPVVGDRIAVDEIAGVQIAVRMEREYLFYEIEIPLRPSQESPLAIAADGTELEQKLEIGLISPEMEGGGRASFRGGFGSRGGGGRSGNRGGRGREGGGERGVVPKPFEAWTTLVLADGDPSLR